MSKSKNNFGLLPYVREDLYGFDPSAGQTYGWEIIKLNVQERWRYSEGEGVKIAVIDTGCDLNHRDLKSNLIDGKNFVEPNQPPIDRNGHGTHVSGTIAASNNQTGIVGVAPKAKIMPVKALNDQGGGSIKDIVRAIEWSVDNGADILTMSLGSPAQSKELEQVINYAASKNKIIFCAAGNSGEAEDIMYPAKYNHTIAIGAIDRNFNRTPFTCSGETLDFLAPGHEILSCVPGDNYALMSGTSMSNPFAAGCAALLLSKYRKTKTNNYSLNSTEDYINIFKQHSINLTDYHYSGIKKYQGYGIIRPV